MLATLADWGYFIFGLYSLVLILVGTPLNLFCFYIFKRLVPNRTNATITIFSYLAVIELLIPFAWNLNYAIRELVWKRQGNTTIRNLEQHSLFVCKLVSFGAYFLLQSSAWLKTLATFTRCVALHNDWTIRRYMLKPNAVRGLCWLTILLIALINSPIWIINGKRVTIVDKHNHTQTQVRCYQSVFFQFWEIVHLLLYNFIPFTLMIICNLSIIRHVKASRRRTQRSKIRSHPAAMKKSSTSTSLNKRTMANSDGRLSRTLIFVTVFFIIFTSPSAIFYISLGKIIKRHRHLITMGLSNLATTSHVTSFFVYWTASSDFQSAAISFLRCQPVMPQRLSSEQKTLDKRDSNNVMSSSLPPSNYDLQRQASSL